MQARKPRYSKEEFARRGDEIYETQIKHTLEDSDHGRIVAIDIRVGHRAVHRFGSRSLNNAQ